MKFTQMSKLKTVSDFCLADISPLRGFDLLSLNIFYNHNIPSGFKNLEGVI